MKISCSLLLLLAFTTQLSVSIAADTGKKVLPVDGDILGTPAVHDGYLYMCTGSEFSNQLTIFDLNDAKNPQFVYAAPIKGQLTSTPQFIGDTAVISTTSGVEIFDITRPEEATRLSNIPPLKAYPQYCAAKLAGDSLLISDDSSIRVFDISDPFAPAVTDITDLVPLEGFPVSKSYLPVSNGESNLLYSIATGRLSLCGPLPNCQETLAATNRLIKFLTDKIAYISCDNSSVCIADMKDPIRPDWTICTNISTSLLPMPRQNGHIYAGSSNILEDISAWKPFEPRSLRKITFPSNVDVHGLTVNGSIAYVANKQCHSLQTFSIATTNATLLSEVFFEHKASIASFATDNSGSNNSKYNADLRTTSPILKSSICIAGKRLFATLPPGFCAKKQKNVGSRLISVDISNPSEPLITDCILLAGYAESLCIVPSTNRIYTAGGKGIAIISFSKQGKLSLDASFALTKNEVYGPHGITIANDGHILAACGADGLKAYNYDGSNLTQKVICETGGFAKDVACFSNSVYVADDTRGLSEFSYSNGVLTKLRTHTLPKGTVNAVAVHNGNAYAACGETPLAVLSSVRPMPYAGRPENEGSGDARYLCIIGQGKKTYAVVADFGNTISLYDVTDSYKPAYVSSLPRSSSGKGAASSALAVASDGKFIFVIDQEQNLKAYDLKLLLP